MLADGYLDFCHDDSVQRIMNRARELGVPTRQEERRLIAEAQAGDERSRELLIVRHTPFVITVAKKYRYRGVEMIDMYHCGLAGLNKGIDKYDLNGQDNRLISYAVWWIRQAILIEVQNTGATIRVPVNKQTKLAHVRRLVKEAAATGDLISSSRIAHQTGLKQEVAEDLILMAIPPLSLDSALRNNGMDDGGEVKDTIGFIEPNEVDDRAEFDWAMRLINESTKLTVREKRVLIERNVHGRSLDSIAQDYKCSRERIRQVEAGALVKIRALTKKHDLKHGITRADRLSMLSMGG